MPGLVLTGKRGDVFWVGDTKVTVLKTGDRAIKLMFDGPKDVPIDRAEVRQAKLDQAAGRTEGGGR